MYGEEYGKGNVNDKRKYRERNNYGIDHVKTVLVAVGVGMGCMMENTSYEENKKIKAQKQNVIKLSRGNGEETNKYCWFDADVLARR